MRGPVPHRPIDLAFALPFVALIALAIVLASPARAQETTAAPIDETPTLSEQLRPRSFLLAPSAAGGPPDAASIPAEPQSQQSGVPGLGKFKIRGISRDRVMPRVIGRTALNFGPKYINAIFGGLEQGSGIALGAELTTADKIPGVELRATGIVSFLGYYRLELTAYFPRVFSENTHLDLWFDYMRRKRDNFFGIGPRTPFEDRTNYGSENRSFNALLTHNLTQRTVIGFYGGVQNIRSRRGSRDDLPAIDALFSGDPRVQPITRWVPGLLSQVKYFSYGAYAEFDYRNDQSGLTRGGYFLARFLSNDDIDRPENRPDIFYDYGWNETELDGRVYLPLGGDRTSLALRSFLQLVSRKGNSQVPFWEESFLGGRRFLRGYRNYRFTAHNILVFSAELRRTVWAQSETSGVDVHLFADAGQVWGDTRSLTDPQILANDKFSRSHWRAGFGGGVGYRLNRDFAVRFELASSPEQSAFFYFSVSRGF